MGFKTVFEDCDILVVGGGMGGTGAAYEARYWGRDLKIVVAEKANIDRSGAVAQGLYAINCYMGMQWDENQPEDHVRYARNDLMGLVREDLLFDMARHVDSAVHQFEEWGLPIMQDNEKGSYMREGRWQIMIHGESYKPIVAEAAKKSADKVYNRVCLTHLLMDEAKENRVAGAVGLLSVRVFGCRDARADEFALAVGEALQLTNILRDVAEDADDGRLYLPHEALEAAGISKDKVGVLISTSVCKDYIEPSVASLVHGQLELSSTCLNFDIAKALSLRSPNICIVEFRM